MVREKMSRVDRAKQFAPFDALKGLHEALEIVEYNHERVQKGEILEDLAEEISNTFIELAKGDEIEVTYNFDDHLFTSYEKFDFDYDEKTLKVGNKKIGIESITKIRKIKKD